MLADLAAVAEQRRRGAPALRKALVWCDARAESAWETPLRVLHQACGIEVEPQYVVRNQLGGSSRGPISAFRHQGAAGV